MTQFKDKSARHPENINVGLFAYPMLMAADILLYRADLVPVGQDQKQHLELARTLASRFNERYSETFVVPEGYIPSKSEGASIRSLSDPTAKMSKSDPSGAVFLTDDDDTIARKFRRAVTDSETSVRYAPTEKPGVSNLLTIYAAFTGKSVRQAEAEFASSDYGTLKGRVADAVIETLRPVRAEYGRILSDKPALLATLRGGAERAYRLARKTLAKVYRKVGLVSSEN